MWAGYARLLGPLQGRPALRDPELWAQADIAAGLKLAEAGQPQAALAVLLPAAGRLRQSGGSPLLPLAAAGCAFACALLQDQPGVLAHLAACSETGGHVPWSVRAAVRYYAAMAQATTGSYAAAAAELLREADRAQANGALAAALRFASGAARLGGTGAADRLAALAEHVPGPFAQACGSFGAGLAAGNAAALVDAAGHAAGEGLNVFAREAARLALVLASGSGDTGLMRVAQKYVYTDSAGFDFCVGRLGGGQPLTLREQEVAELVAAGQSNADIARHFGVSVRTVEGHLYKLYAKLQPKFEPVAGGLATGRKTHG
jgi:hypothetical protein